MEEQEVSVDVLEEDKEKERLHIKALLLNCIFTIFMLNYAKWREKIMLEVIEDTLIDAIKLLPFLFITYLIMEYVEHKMGEKSKKAIKKSGKFGPIIGGILGAFPQCGFSVSATNLYAGRVITLGTLIAVYLSTSDEMLQIFISEAVSPIIILKI